MDFITLATETDPRRILRLVHDVLGGASDASDDAADGAAGSHSGDDVDVDVHHNERRFLLLNNLTATTNATATTASSTSSIYNKPPPLPLLSKAAEAELYLLATNFLLYVAMVIIATMVAKIYFPEALTRGNGNTNANTNANTNGTWSSSQSPRSFSYRRRRNATSSTGQEQELGELELDELGELDELEQVEYYGSDAEEDEEEDGDQYYSDGDDVDELLDSDDDDDNANNNAGGRQAARSSRTTGSSSRGGTGTGTTGVNRRRFNNFLEFQQASLSKTQVIQRLVFCCLMLNITFVAWGALQERMLTRKYPRYTGEYFTYSYALVFTNRFWTLIMSGMLLMYLKPRASRTTVLYEYSFPSISNMLSSWCQYEALRYVSFPAATIFKSFKLAPVMAMGRILGNKTYPIYDYFVALLIGVGIAMFMTSTDDLRFGYDIYGTEVSTAWTGVLLLFLFLFFDSFTSQFQSRMFQRHRDLSMVELMFATSAFSTVLSLVTLVHTKELYPALNFVMQHSEIHVHFLLFSICSTIGQLFIFYTIKNFGAVVFTLIMTTRILLSIALSCVMYGHKVTATGFFGLCLVMAAVLYRIRRKAQGQQLLKWQGMEDGGQKSHELVQEWHEHVDM